jgi:ABC-type dipeptide/oligopeptide/nickel transport system ATPase subunit
MSEPVRAVPSTGYYTGQLWTVEYDDGHTEGLYNYKSSAQRVIRRHQRRKAIMEARTQLLGLSGKAGAGKDTLAELLVRTGKYRRLAFADALKRDVATMLYGNASPGSIARLNADKREKPEVRALLQSYGVAQRALNPDYWVDKLFAEADRRLHFNATHDVMGLVITDVRFRNEAAAVRARGGKVVRVARPGYYNGLTAEQQAHASETELDAYAFDYVVMNAGVPEHMLDYLRWVSGGELP